MGEQQMIPARSSFSAVAAKLGATSPTRWGWGAAVLSALLAASWAASGQCLLLLSALLALAGSAPTSARARLLALAAGLGWGGIAALGWHFVADHFTLRYVWLYSSAELPWHLKLANLWGGDEGGTLLLACFCLSLAAGAARDQGEQQVRSRWSVLALIGACYTVLAWWLGPFVATPAAWLAEAAAQGMNAHLMKIWMLIHAPLVLLAYAWSLSLAAPALAALAGDASSWPASARQHARLAWLVLTAGIGAGMVWAFEDSMYGQIWHWDPVQTVAFALWCVLGAHVHGVAGWRAGRRRSGLMPWAAIAAAILAALALTVTRNPLLASSHRYVDAQSWRIHLVLAILLLMLALSQAWLGSRRRAPAGAGRPRAAAELGLWLTQLGFLLAAAAALAQLAWAFAAEALGWPRPDEFKPFLGLLVNMISGAEQDALLAAFEQWDVDGYALARLLMLPLLVLGLVGGWYFCRRLSRAAGWISLGLVALAILGLWQGDGVLSQLYIGRGILSQQIVALLPLLDACLLAGAYLALACLSWALLAAWRGGRKGLRAALPLALIHGGVVVMLWGGLISIALNTYSQHELPAADLLAGQHRPVQADWLTDRQGFSFRVGEISIGAVSDGGRNVAHAIQALSTVEIRDPEGRLIAGETLYRDDRSTAQRYGGPLRQVCELLDYRYARHLGTPGYLLDPLISHQWGRSVQFWLSPAAVALSGDETGAQPPLVVAVIKVFPFLSLLWLGLGLTLAGALWLAWPQRQ